MDEDALRDLFKTKVLDCAKTIYVAIFKSQGNLRDDELKTELLVGYLNYEFKSLITEKDETVVNYYNAMQMAGGHSHVCIMGKLFRAIHHTMQHFEQFDLETKEEVEFEKAIDIELERFLAPVIADIKFEKECKGPMDLEAFDPDRPYYAIGRSPRVLYPKPGVLCANCRKFLDTKAQKMCSGCKSIYYCGKECQKADRKIHKEMCFIPYYQMFQD